MASDCGCGKGIPAAVQAYEWASDDGRTETFSTGDPQADLEAARLRQRSERTGIIRSRRVRQDALPPTPPGPGVNPRTIEALDEARHRGGR